MGVVRITDAPSVEEGDVVALEVEGVMVAVARSDGQLYAFQDACTHKECPLSTGFVDGTDIECECHGGMFDMRTGEPTRSPAYHPIRVFNVEEEGGDLVIEVDE